jgi:NAD(P)H-hydrate epimerase
MLRLNRTQLREIDRLAVERYKIPGVVLMENAARAVADTAMQMLGSPGDVLIVCGGGNNGGDGLAAARHLHNRGCSVRIFLTIDPNRFDREAKINWEIVQAMRLPIVAHLETESPKLVLDAIFGTGLSQPPRDPFAKIAKAMAALRVPILAVDIPSGLDCDTGKPLSPDCVKADVTVTFVAEKSGFAEAAARAYLGRVVVGDIGCPVELIEEISRT